MTGKNAILLGDLDWLTDKHISAANQLLKRGFPQCKGLDNPIFGSMVCARAIRGLRGQSVVCGTNYGSKVCAGLRFAHNTLLIKINYKSFLFSFYDTEQT